MTRLRLSVCRNKSAWKSVTGARHEVERSVVRGCDGRWCGCEDAESRARIASDSSRPVRGLTCVVVLYAQS